ncbi:hypothetical protein BWQ96_05190 [Gracilariopsis chorda]|uniref:Uncharacterized protein n=1 Tax=Gracilariopsis chorda TaxID=448386 RepID=A0A2V3ISH6_9FLOR|nr:hypothetical protein BWQ96_05190 [Gracilariopsis chorda]|eukprot:PXF45049.1 hypothetical protein BWQ96_05190 [Gracilariopsis chorda]
MHLLVILVEILFHSANFMLSSAELETVRSANHKISGDSSNIDEGARSFAFVDGNIKVGAVAIGTLNGPIPFGNTNEVC